MAGAAVRKQSARGVHRERRWRAVVRTHGKSGEQVGFVDAWWPDGSFLGRFRFVGRVDSDADLQRIAIGFVDGSQSPADACSVDDTGN